MVGIKHHWEVRMRRSQWAKRELPVLGPRAARGQEAVGGKVGWALMLPGEVSSGRWERGRDQKGEDLVYCFGPGNMSLFAGERSQERPRNKRRGTVAEGGPTGGAGNPAVPPPRLEAAERARNLWFDFLSRIEVECVCAFPQNTENTEEKAKGQGGSSHCPPPELQEM